MIELSTSLIDMPETFVETPATLVSPSKLIFETSIFGVLLTSKRRSKLDAAVLPDPSEFSAAVILITATSD